MVLSPLEAIEDDEDKASSQSEFMRLIGLARKMNGFGYWTALSMVGGTAWHLVTCYG